MAEREEQCDTDKCTGTAKFVMNERRLCLSCMQKIVNRRK